MVPSGQTKGTRQGAGPQLLSEGGEVRVTRQPSCQSKPKEVGDIQELAEDSVDHVGKECYIQDHALTFRVSPNRADTVIKGSLFCFQLLLHTL